jgi:hypothetical protein
MRLPPFLFRLLAVKVPEDRSADFWRLASPAPSSAAASRLLRKLSAPLPTPPGTLVELFVCALACGVFLLWEAFFLPVGLWGVVQAFWGRIGVSRPGSQGRLTPAGHSKLRFPPSASVNRSCEADRGLKCVCAFFFFSSIFVFFGLEKKFCRVEEKNLLFECSVLVFEKKFAGGARGSCFVL